MQSDKNQPLRPPRLKLPFEKRKRDAGEWAYDHRVGLCITVIAYLLLGIAFVSTRILIQPRHVNDTFYIDLSEMERIEKELQQAQELNRMLNREQADAAVENRTSNEHAAEAAANTLDERLRDAKGTDAAHIYESAEQVQERLQASRSGYEAGLREEQAIIEAFRNRNSGKGESADTKVRGRVTVSFSLNNPLRTQVDLFVPAYQCEGGGEITVAIEVDRNGRVTSASAVPSSPGYSDRCLATTAEAAARRSRFNVAPAAPERQRGTITYLFVPQR